MDAFSKAAQEQAIYDSFEAELSRHFRALDSGRISPETFFRSLIHRDPDLELFSTILVDSPLPDKSYENLDDYICDARRGDTTRIKHHSTRLDGHRVYLVGSKDNTRHYEVDLKVSREIKPAPIFDASSGRLVGTSEYFSES